MSKKHPVIAVTGSSGAGTTTVKRAFEHIFWREKITPAIIEGDSLHSLNRMEFREAMKKAEIAGNCWLTMPPWSRERTWISRAISPNPLP